MDNEALSWDWWDTWKEQIEEEVWGEVHGFCWLIDGNWGRTRNPLFPISIVIYQLQGPREATALALVLSLPCTLPSSQHPLHHRPPPWPSPAAPAIMILHQHLSVQCYASPSGEDSIIHIYNTTIFKHNCPSHKMQTPKNRHETSKLPYLYFKKYTISQKQLLCF